MSSRLGTQSRDAGCQAALGWGVAGLRPRPLLPTLRSQQAGVGRLWALQGLEAPRVEKARAPAVPGGARGAAQASTAGGGSLAAAHKVALAPGLIVLQME